MISSPNWSVAHYNIVSEIDSAKVAEWVARFLGDLENGRLLSLNTVQGYRRDLDHFQRYLEQGAVDWVDLNPHQVREFVAQRHRKGASSRTIQRNLSAIRAFYRFLLQEKLVESNPAVGVSAPKGSRKLPSTLDVDQMAGLLNKEFEGNPPEDDPLSVRDLAMFELFYSSGLRLSELVNADCGAIQFDEETIQVVGKGRKERIIPVGSQALQAVQEWLPLRDQMAAVGEMALFVSQRGKRISPRTIQQRLADWARQRGITQHVHPHLLRHSFASHILESSGNLRAVQEMLGHKNIGTTQIYTHLDFQHLAEVYDQAHPRSKQKSRLKHFVPTETE